MVDATTIAGERERTGHSGATAERMAHAGSDGIEIGHHGIQRVVAAPLDRLRSAGVMTDREFAAGDKYRCDAFAARIDPAAPTVDWGALGGNFGPRVPSEYSSQAIFEARARHRQTLRCVRGVIRTVVELALIRELSLAEIGRSVFGRAGDRDATVAGTTGVRMACAALADVYGM